MVPSSTETSTESQLVVDSVEPKKVDPSATMAMDFEEDPKRKAAFLESKANDLVVAVHRRNKTSLEWLKNKNVRLLHVKINSILARRRQR
ncbi:unnamed protein product [Trichobilharzia regenti]|nr:unnamed protein product [Trichobilharzia regenti]